jgi:hypothetical protein
MKNVRKNRELDGGETQEKKGKIYLAGEGFIEEATVFEGASQHQIVLLLVEEFDNERWTMVRSGCLKYGTRNLYLLLDPEHYN